MKGRLLTNNTRIEDRSKAYYIRALAFYLLIVPLDAIKLFENVSFMRVLVLLPLFLALPKVKQGLKMTYNTALLILYLGIIIFSVLYSRDSSFSSERALTIALNGGVVVFFSLLNLREDEYGLLKKAYLASSWFAAFLMIVTSITTISATGRISISNGTSTQDANYVCGYLLYAAAYYAGELLNQKSKKIVSFAILLFFTILIFMTGSRGGLLAFLFTVIAVLLFNIAQKRKRFQTIFVVAILVAAFVILSPYIVELLPQTVADRFSLQAVLQDRGTGRTVLWRNIIEAFKEAPLWRQMAGYGIGTSVYFTWNGLFAHNMWLEYLIGIGLIGTAVVFVFYVRLARLSWKRAEYVLFATLMGYLMMSISLSIMTYKPLWNISLLILLIEKKIEVQNEEMEA